MLRGRGGRIWGMIAFGLTAAAVSGCAPATESDGSGGRQPVSRDGSGGREGSGGSSGMPSGSGGALGSGGSAGSGGVTTPAGSGGAAGNHGAGTGGASAGGGAGGNGAPGAGGDGGMRGGPAGGGGTASGGTAGGGGRTGIGGSSGSIGGRGGGGGTVGGGGTTGAGGAAGAAACALQVRPATSGTRVCSNMRSKLSSGYSYELWQAGGGSGCMTVPGIDANYSASWTNSADFLSRAGLAFDSTKTPAQIGTIDADFAETFTEVPVQGATSKIYVALYGWTIDPLMEYYVIEDYGDFIPGPTSSDGSPRTNYGTLTVDDGIYDIWALPVKNRPAITGNNKDFTQIFNVRRVRRKCGHISLSAHFAKWNAVGLTLGKLEEAMFLMEAQNNSGTIDVAATVTLKP